MKQGNVWFFVCLIWSGLHSFALGQWQRENYTVAVAAHLELLCKANIRLPSLVPFKYYKILMNKKNWE